MEIILAMVLSIGKFITLLVQAAIVVGVIGGILTVVGVVAIAIDKQRKENESTPRELMDEIDEETYGPQPGSRLVVSRHSDRMWRELDRLNDENILKNTEEL